MYAGLAWRMSLSMTTKSASLPGPSVPLIPSSNDAYAADDVYARSASSTVIRCSGTRPSGLRLSSVLRGSAA
jgi:hypothetical protein